MSNESPQTPPKKLTLDDPVDKQTMAQLEELEQRRLQVADRLLDLEQEKVKVLGAAHQIDQQRHRIFEKILLERGLPPNAPATIDAQTARVQLVHMNGTPAAQPQQPPPEQAATTT